MLSIDVSRCRNPSVILLFMLLISSSFLVHRPSHGQVADYRVEVVAENLDTPWSIVFPPDGRIFLTERPGRIRVVQAWKLLSEPAAQIPVVENGESGLLGLALDPNFSENHHVYVYYTHGQLSRLVNRVSRFTEKDNRFLNETVILDNIPAGSIHDGGRIRFGPDGKLYVSVGEAGQRNLAQDINSLGGKILRINSDGSVPSDNLFPNSPVYSLGHRNPQGMDWHPASLKLVITEHGPSGERGFAHDEVNVVEPGRNYGWPVVVGSSNDPKFVNPIIHSGDETWAPSGATFYRSAKIGFFKDKMIVATLRGQHLRVLGFDEQLQRVSSNEALFRGDYGRLRDVVEGPDGYIYFSTSNWDGRGTPHPKDDRILRIVPSEESLPKVIDVEADGRIFNVQLKTDVHINDFKLEQQMKRISFKAEAFKLPYTLIELILTKEMLGGPYLLSVDSREAGFSIAGNATHAILIFSIPEGRWNISLTGLTVIPEFPLGTIAYLAAILSLFTLLPILKWTHGRTVRTNLTSDCKTQRMLNW